MISLDLSAAAGPFPLRVEAAFSSRAVAVVGRSGAGKSTLLKAIAGLLPATGRVAVGGEALLDTAAGVDLPAEQRRVGWVPQESLLFPHLTVAENIAFGRAATPARVAEAADLLELGPLLARYPAALSGGERQRAALARALATGPRLLLLDEPLAAVDVELRERIFPYLLRVRDQARVPMLYVTHQFGEAQALATEALLLDGGRALRHGPAAEVLNLRAMAQDPQSRYENVLDGAGAGGRLRVGELALTVPRALGDGERATYVLPAEDVLVATVEPRGLSARNVWPARVTALEQSGDDVLLRADASGCALVAHLTHLAATTLELAPGRDVFLVVKSHSLRRIR